MRILVVGASGTVGSAVVAALSGRHEVVRDGDGHRGLSVTGRAFQRGARECERRRAALARRAS